jgi:hypothetical protein
VRSAGHIPGQYELYGPSVARAITGRSHATRRHTVLLGEGAGGSGRGDHQARVRKSFYEATARSAVYLGARGTYQMELKIERERVEIVL